MDDLIAFLQRLTAAQQLHPGLNCVSETCTDGNRVLIDNSSTLVRWMIELRPSAKHHGQLPQWQHLVDTLVTGGYTRLAPYSV
ncbi:hypothetical protein [Pseudonocardia alni]|uniref:hypothetical protein n=1 Tax=Pseudonocardia alni TaxID=33907 RepID=UPI00331E2EEF